MAAFYDEKLGKFTVVDRKEGNVIGYYIARNESDAINMAKADQAKYQLGE